MGRLFRPRRLSYPIKFLLYVLGALGYCLLIGYLLKLLCEAFSVWKEFWLQLQRSFM